MKKILLLEYQGNCKKDNEPIGHPIKIINEYTEMIGENFIIDVIAPQNILDNIDLTYIHKLKKLPFHFIIAGKKINKYIKDILLSINILIASVQKGYDALWFCNVNNFLFKLLHFFPKKIKKKIVCTMYSEDYKTKKSVSDFAKERKKYGLIIYTIKTAQVRNKKQIYLPDYCYDSDFYIKYQNLKKEEKVICIGTMSSEKKLEDLVDVFNQIDYPLEICGYFREPEREEKLKIKANKNIKIENRYLTTEEYFNKLAKAKYAIIPYDTERYYMRTSGVLQECVFVNTIPITFNKILEQNDTRGVGIEQLSELVDFEFKNNDFDKLLQNYKFRRENEFAKDVVKQKLIKALNDIEEKNDEAEHFNI